MILEEETLKAYGYHTEDSVCKKSKPIIAACDTCGKIRITTKHNYRDLCIACAAFGNKNSLGCICPNEKKFKIRETLKGRYIRDKNPNYKGGKIKTICKQCGAIVCVYPYKIKNKKNIYCNKSCLAKAKRHNTKPAMTKPEEIFELMCIKYSLPFKFVGDGSLWLGNANPDFIHNSKKIVVEVFGDYWHSPLLNRMVKNDRTLQSRQKQLKAEGYTCIFIWESDLKREDAEKFVMHIMRKEGIFDQNEM